MERMKNFRRQRSEFKILLFFAFFSLLPDHLANAHPQLQGKRIERILFGSCAHQDRDQNFWKSILEKHPQVCLLIGDNIYGDSEDPEVLRRKYGQLSAQPSFQRLRENCHLLATWDDHDFGLNDAGSELKIKKESKEAFLEFLKTPADSPRRKHEGVYDSEILGAGDETVQIILLDTRTFRTELKVVSNSKRRSGYDYLPNVEPGATLLGEAQWAWLEGELNKPARLRLLVSSIQLASDEAPKEKWANFPKEEERLFALLRKTNATGVVVLSGDAHFAELSVLPNAIGYPLFDFTASGFNVGEVNWYPPQPNRNRVAIMSTGSNFGMLEIDWKAPEPQIGFFIYHASGDLYFRQYFPLNRLK